MTDAIYGFESRTLNKQIIALANNGLSIKQIADMVGMNKPAVASRMTILMRQGKLKRHSERTGAINTQVGRYHILNKRYGKRLGSMGEMLTKLTIDEASWLYKTTPADMTVAEWVAVLLRDVVAEEGGQ